METFENFLSSDAFEKMAREYQAKYATASIMQNKEDEKLLEKVENAFSQIFRLFYLFDYVIEEILLGKSKSNIISKVFSNLLVTLFNREAIKADNNKIFNLKERINIVRENCRKCLGKDIEFNKIIDKNQIIHKQCLFCLIDIERLEVDLTESFVILNNEQINRINTNANKYIISKEFIENIKQIFIEVFNIVKIFYDII